MVRKSYVSLTKKRSFLVVILFCFKAKKPNKRGVTWRKFSDQKFWIGRSPSAIAVCLSVMMVVWECCTRRNRWQGHIYHWKVGLKSTKPHTFFICDVVVGGCAVLYRAWTSTLRLNRRTRLLAVFYFMKK